MLVVLDTNVILSALLFSSGRLSWIRIAIGNGSICPLASKGTVLELMQVLAYPKFRLSRSQIDDLLSDYLPFCTIVDVPADMVMQHCRDAADTKFLELAAAGKAEAVVTGDKDLLELREGFQSPILQPSDLKDRLLGC